MNKVIIVDTQPIDHETNDALQLLKLHTSELRIRGLASNVNWYYVANHIKSYSEVEIICFIKEALENAILRSNGNDVRLTTIDFRRVIYKFPTTYKFYTKAANYTTREDEVIIEKYSQNSIHNYDDTIDIIFRFMPWAINCIDYDESEMIRYFRYIKENVTDRERLCDKKRIHNVFIQAIFYSTCNLLMQSSKYELHDSVTIGTLKKNLRELRKLFLLYKDIVPDTISYIVLYFEELYESHEIAKKVIEKSVNEGRSIFKDGSTIDIYSDEYKRREAITELVEGFTRNLLTTYYAEIENELNNKEREKEIDDIIANFITDMKKINN